MRRATMLAVGAVLLAFNAQTGHCQVPTHVFYLHMGASMPMAPGPFADFRSAGLVTGAGVGFPASNRFQLLLGLDHSRNPIDEKAVSSRSGLPRDDVVDIPGNVSWWTVTMGLRASARSSIYRSAVPYVHGNLAFVRMTGNPAPPYVQSGTFDPSSLRIRQSAPGGVFGAGVEFDVGDTWNFYLEFRMSVGFGGTTSMVVPVVAGVSFW